MGVALVYSCIPREKFYLYAKINHGFRTQMMDNSIDIMIEVLSMHLIILQVDYMVDPWVFVPTSGYTS